MNNVVTHPAFAAKVAQVEERCEYTQEVMGTPPHWLVRWGISVIFIVIAVVVLISFMVKYPEVIPAQIIVTTPEPPVSVVARAAGSLAQIAVQDQQNVVPQQILAVIDSTADTQGIQDIQTLINRAQATSRPDQALGVLLKDRHYQLGEFHDSYAQYQKTYDEYSSYQRLNALGSEMNMLQVQINQYQQVVLQRQEQQQLLEQEIKLLEKDYQRVEQLYQQQMLSMKTVEDKHRELLQLRRQSRANALELSNTQIHSQGLKQQWQKLQLEQSRQNQMFASQLNEAYTKLVNQLKQWNGRYIIRAPVAGKVTFIKPWADHQFINNGDELLVVVPQEQQEMIGKVRMSTLNSGKVKLGQRVYIKLHPYPFQEYGIIEGVVKSISLVPRQDHYAIEVSLPQGLTTSYHKTLVFKQEMQGNAEIVTEDLRLIERFFHQIVKAMKS